VLDDASLLIVFLPAVQSDGSMFHSQWRSVTKSFHHQPRNRGANLITPLSAQFRDSRSGFVEPNERTFLNTLRHQSCCSHFPYILRVQLQAVCNPSVVWNEFISTLKQQPSSGWCWPAWAMFVIEFRLVFHRTRIHEAQRLTMLLSAALTPYIFFKPFVNVH
jgi:hypothetical protein